MKLRQSLFAAGLVAGVFFSAPVSAQLTVEITGAGANRLPVAIADFDGERIVARALTSVVRADLERSGLFRLVDARATDVMAFTNHPGGVPVELSVRACGGALVLEAP